MATVYSGTAVGAFFATRISWRRSRWATARCTARLERPVSLSIEVDDVEQAHQELTALGVAFSKPPTKEQWGTSAVFQDPDGNSFVLASR